MIDSYAMLDASAILLVVIAVAAVLLTRSRALRTIAEARANVAGELAAAQARVQEAQERLLAREALVTEQQQALARAGAEQAALAQDNHWLREEIARHQQTIGSTEQLLCKAEAQLRDTFQSLAADALNSNRGAFLDLARTSFEGLQKEAALQLEARQRAIDTLVQPIAEALKKVDGRLHEAERERLETFARLTQQVTDLSLTTESLARALRTPAVRGRWGEMQLRRVVELAGMLPKCDFEEQPGLYSDAGRLRPDLLVHLPGGKQLVVDAKVPLEAFLEGQECTDPTLRQLKLQTHARHVRDHMDKLGSKAYWDSLDSSPDMVVMFLPGETLFATALEHDLTLIEHGLRQRVLLASPITLIALLTTVAHAWRQEALTENYREVARMGKELYERVAVFTDHFEDMRKKLDGAVQAYNRSAASLESRVLVTARKLKELDVTTAPEIPPAEPIDTVPRVLKQAGLMGLPEGAVTESEAS